MTEANNIPTIEDDLNTTAPQSSPAVWKMPEPVFRKTSGKLPQDFLKDGVAVASPENSIPPASPVGGAAIESEPQVEPRNPTLKLMLVLLGLVAMVAFIVVFLTVIYFFFFYGESSPSPVP